MAKKKASKVKGMTQAAGIKLGSMTVVTEDHVAPPAKPAKRAWFDYCPKCDSRDMRDLPLGEQHLRVHRKQCGVCHAARMVADILKDEE
jgi:hypothetical protein